MIQMLLKKFRVPCDMISWFSFSCRGAVPILGLIDELYGIGLRTSVIAEIPMDFTVRKTWKLVKTRPRSPAQEIRVVKRNRARLNRGGIYMYVHAATRTLIFIRDKGVIRHY